MADLDWTDRQAGIDTLAAMTNPVRRRMIDLLSVHGPATVGMLAEETGERVGSISHHLKVLAKTGLIEEAPDLARDRRESWWRIVKGSWRWSVNSFADDPAGEVVARAAEEQQLRANSDKVRAWYDSREDRDPAWSEAAYVSTSWIRATPAELTELGARMEQLIREFVVEPPAAGDRPAADDGRESVYLFTYGIPARP
jgi:DNA-binding transcriptional ArsR family regulator